MSDGALQSGWIKVMAAFLPAAFLPAAFLPAAFLLFTARIARTFGGGEEVLPDEVAGGVGIPGRKRAGQIDFASAGV